ncbi:MAG: late competence development ComFB family protein [Desulfitobacterium hafniense]|nr:late competence development ComFB family protein [Desulfitobacterium hafniense]
MYELKNHTEIVVRQALQDYLKQTALPCACEHCQADILALALNKLPAKYYVSPRGEILTNWESQATPDQAKVMAEVVRAAQIVSAAPSHPIDLNN